MASASSSSFANGLSYELVENAGKTMEHAQIDIENHSYELVEDAGKTVEHAQVDIENHSCNEVVEDAGKTVEHARIDIENHRRNLAPRPTSDCCIYRVHRKLRDLNPAAYSPSIVSFGPFHHGKEEYAAMEDEKLRHLSTFVKRTKMSLDEVLHTVSTWEPRARRCYSEKIDLSSAKFVKMLLIDGAFLFECMLQDDENVDDFRDAYKKWQHDAICEDILVLENQVPLFVIDGLHNLANKGSGKLPALQAMIYNHLKIFGHEIPLTESLHMLDALHSLHTPIALPKDAGRFRPAPCATKLHEAGIKFKVCGTYQYFDEIHFDDKNGVLEIPNLYFAHYFEPRNRNIMAFEQFHYPYRTYFCDIMFFLDSLINTPEDVDLLEKHGVITNFMSANETVHNMINKLGKHIALNDEYQFSSITKQLHEYCRIPKHEWMATFRRDYFSTPWRVLSIVAAVILLLLTLMQTVTSIVAFFV